MTEIKALLKQEDIARIEEEANTTIKRMDNSDSAQLNAIVEQLGSLGETTQLNASRSLEVLKRPVKELMDGKHKGISDTLIVLRGHVDELNPSKVFKKGFISNIAAKITGNSPLTKYIRKYESVQTQIDQIIGSLYQGKDQLEADTIGLRQVKESAEEKIYDLEKRIYFGQKLMELMEIEIAKPEREFERKTLEKGMVKAVSRVKNMMQMVNILQQSIASVDIIADNNEKLDEAILNAITMTSNIVTVTATLQLALKNQKTTIDAVNATNEAIGDMLRYNAKTLRSNTEETNKLLEKPAIAIEILKAAFEDTFAALENTRESDRKILESSKVFIKELDGFNKEMMHKLSPGRHALPSAKEEKSTRSLMD